MMTTSPATIDLIKEEEGFSPTAYPDAGMYSIGYGTLLDTANLQAQYMNATIDREEGEALLFMKLRPKEQVIRDRIRVPLNQNQFDALCLLVYNTGPAPLTTGSLDDLINSNAGEAAIRAKWLEYSYSQGQFLQALRDRRQREVDLYFTPVQDEKKKPSS